MNRLPATRASLLELKAKRTIAARGRDLLRDKREALARVAFDLARDILGGRERVDQCLREASRALTLARAIDGEEALESLALAAGQEILVEIRRERVWGLPAYAIKAPKLTRTAASRGTSPAAWSFGALSAARLHEEAMELLIAIATREVLLRRLGSEIRRTSRRINALEQIVLPTLEAESSRVALVLAESERAEGIRLRRLKHRRQSTVA